MAAADDRTAIHFKLSAGQDHDAPHGRELVNRLKPPPEQAETPSEQAETPSEQAEEPEQLQFFVVADRAYEGDETRNLITDRGYTPVIPPKSNRKQPWNYNREIYKRRNEVERLFRRIKAYRRVFSRYDKLDTVFKGFITLVLIIEALRNVT